jgi:hypothetical protein
VSQLSFSPDGAEFAAGSFDLSTSLWTVSTRKEIGNSFPERLAAVPAPRFEPNGRLLIDYLADAAQWPTDVATWERFACQVAGRDMTRAEWRTILPARPYIDVCPGLG